MSDQSKCNGEMLRATLLGRRKRRCVHDTLFFLRVCLLISPLSLILYLSYLQCILSLVSLTFSQEIPMVENMCLRDVMFAGCKWMQVFASGCSWMHIHTLLVTRSAQSLHIAYCIKLCVGSYIYGCIMVVLSYGYRILVNGCVRMQK